MAALLSLWPPISFVLCLVAVLLAAGKPTSSSHRHNGTRFPEVAAYKDYPYGELVAPVTAHCYNHLQRDPYCCVDQTYHPGVKRRVFNRNGTEWMCDDVTKCNDTLKGRRGYDAVWIPDNATCRSTRILYIHGGSWKFGSPDSLGYGQLASKLAGMTGAVVMVPDYPLLPQGNYKTILKAARAALEWLGFYGPWEKSDCTGDHPPLFVGGDSSGGGTALSLLLHLKRSPHEYRLIPDDRTGRLVAGGFFFSPWTNLVCNTPDYYHHAYAKIVDTNAFSADGNGTVFVGDIIFRGHPDENAGGFQLNGREYAGDVVSLTDPLASPFYAGARELQGGGVPPLYFAVGASESIMGDSVLVAQKAAAYGAEINLDIFEGMWHVFPMYSEGCGFGSELWPAMRALNHTARHIKAVENTGHPFSGSALGDPYTQYVYDRSFSFRSAWFGPDPGYKPILLEELVANPLALAAPWQSGMWHLHFASVIIGGVGVLLVQAAARSWQQRREQEGTDSENSEASSGSASVGSGGKMEDLRSHLLVGETLS